MTKSEINSLAKEIKMMKGFIPNNYRLLFAEVIRNTFQFSINWPGWNKFKEMCDLPINN